jgi:hypothetical protein
MSTERKPVPPVDYRGAYKPVQKAPRARRKPAPKPEPQQPSQSRQYGHQVNPDNLRWSPKGIAAFIAEMQSPEQEALRKRNAACSTGTRSQRMAARDQGLIDAANAEDEERAA